MSKANNIASLLHSSGLLDSDDIATSAITNSKIASGAIDSDAIGTDAITAAKLNIGQVGGRRNLIINGNFDVWQRGTSGSTGYVADRWKTLAASSTTAVSQQSFTLGQTDVPNEPEYFHRVVVTSVAGASNYALLQQRIEFVRTFAGQTVTVSFWAKADAAKNIAVEFSQDFGIGGSAAVFGVDVTTCSLTTGWQKFTATADLPSISGKTIGTGQSSLDILFWFDAGSDINSRSNSLGQQSGTFDIAQVQLELGDTATPFEHRSYGEELALCQRYYIQTPSNTAQKRMFNDGASSKNLCINGDFPVTMRAAPSMTVRGDIGDTSQITLGTTAGMASTTYGFSAFEEVYAGGFVDMHYYIAAAEL